MKASACQLQRTTMHTYYKNITFGEGLQWVKKNEINIDAATTNVKAQCFNF